jgi:hypothetical protein
LGADDLENNWENCLATNVKKTVQTGFGTIKIANNRYFMGNCTRQSGIPPNPYLQELSVFFVKIHTMVQQKIFYAKR